MAKKRKRYSINWEDEAPVSFEVDGVQYESLENITDETDRLKLEAMVNSAEDAAFDAEFAEMQAKVEEGGISGEKIILGVFTGVAVLMLLIAGLSSVSNILKISREEQAPGQVVEIVSRREYVNEEDRVLEEYYFPVVIYVSSDGRPHRVHMSIGSSSPSHEVGDEVTVLYNPEQPLDARIQSFGSSALMWILPVITGILGIAFLGAVLIVQRVLQPNETA